MTKLEMMLAVLPVVILFTSLMHSYCERFKRRKARMVNDQIKIQNKLPHDCTGKKCQVCQALKGN